MEYTLESKEDKCDMWLAGSMSIEDVGEIKKNLTDSLSSYTSVTVNIKEVQKIDMAVIQLFCSANRSFEKNNKLLTAEGVDNPVIKSSLTEIGYDNDFECTKLCETCFWKGEE